MKRIRICNTDFCSNITQIESGCGDFVLVSVMASRDKDNIFVKEPSYSNFFIEGCEVKFHDLYLIMLPVRKENTKKNLLFQEAYREGV